MARLLGAVVAPRGRMRRRRRLPLRILAAPLPLLLLLLLLLAVAPLFASPIDESADDDDKNANPRNLFERSYFQLPEHLREAARADLGGVEFDRGLYIGGEETRKRGEKKKEKKGVAAGASAKKTTSTSTSSSSAAAAAASAAAAAAARQAAAGDLVKVMLVQPDAQQMEAIMRGEHVK